MPRKTKADSADFAFAGRSGDILSALTDLWLPVLKISEARVLFRLVNQVTRYKTDTRELTATFLISGLLPNGESKIPPINLHESKFWAAKASLIKRWPGLITLTTVRNRTCWRVDLAMILAGPDSISSTGIYERRELPDPKLAKESGADLDGSQTSTSTSPPGEADLSNLGSGALPKEGPLNKGSKSGLEIRKEIIPPSKPADDEIEGFEVEAFSGGIVPTDTLTFPANEIGGFRVGFSLSCNAPPAASTFPGDSALDRTNERPEGEIASGQLFGAPCSGQTEASACYGKSTAEQKATLEVLVRTWDEAVAQHYPSMMTLPLTPAHRAQLKRALRSWPAGGASPQEVMLHAIREWRPIIISKFSWLRKKVPPELPDIGFFACWWVHFVRVFEEGRYYQLAPGERTRLQAVMSRGVSEAKAMLILAEEQITAQRRKPQPFRDYKPWTNPNWKPPIK